MLDGSTTNSEGSGGEEGNVFCRIRRSFCRKDFPFIWLVRKVEFFTDPANDEQGAVRIG